MREQDLREPGLTEKEPKRLHFGNIVIDRVDMDGAVERVAAHLAGKREQCFQVTTPNAQFVQLAKNDASFAAIVHGADLSVADGVPLVWASRLLGCPLPGRVNGTDMMLRLCEEAPKRGWSVYFLGGQPGAAEKSAEVMRAQHPGLKVAGTDCPPMGFINNPELDAEAVRRIDAAAPDIVFVALGAPKQEVWASTHRHIGAGVLMGVGGSFEMVAGMAQRAPVWMQRYGLEWMWRLIVEPRRMWKRYLVGNTYFVMTLVRALAGRYLAPGRSQAPQGAGGGAE